MQGKSTKPQAQAHTQSQTLEKYKGTKWKNQNPNFP